MKRILICLLAAGLSVVDAGSLAAAQNVTAATKSKSQVDSTAPKPTRQTQFSMAAIDQSKKTDYKAAQAKAQKDYKDAMAKCQRRSSSAKRQCMTDAKATRTQALAQAKTQWGDQK